MGKQNERLVFLTISEVWVDSEIKWVYNNLLANNNPEDLTEDKMNTIKDKLKEILLSKLADGYFFKDLIKEAIKEAKVIEWENKP